MGTECNSALSTQGDLVHIRAIGASSNDDWRPFGYLKPFKNLSTGETVFAREAVFFKTDGSRIIHNGDWSEFVSKFGSENVKQIYP